MGLLVTSGATASTGSGTVNSGTANQIAYYASGGTAVSGLSSLTWASNTLTVGASATAAAITTNGAANLTLSTNNGASSGTIIINNGANGVISIAPNGTGSTYIGGNSSNYFTLTGAASGTGPTVAAAGATDANVNFNVQTKGTGSFVVASTTTNTTSNITASGANANINLVLAGKGTGVVDLGAVTAVKITGGTPGQVLTTNGSGVLSWATGGGGSMVYPASGIANSTGTAWGTSYSTTGTGTVVALQTQPSFTTDIRTPKVTTASAVNLVLDTNAGTTSGNITITQGANGDIILLPNGTGQVLVGSTTAGILNIQGTATSGTATLTTNVTTGIVNAFTGVTTGTLNLATGGASTTNIGGTAGSVNIGTITGNSTLTIRGNATTGTATLTTNVTTGLVNAFTGVSTGTVTIGSAAAGRLAIAFNQASTSTITGAVTIAGGLGVAGAVNAQTKSFIISHPTKPGKLLKHGSLEGPEFGVYVRGKVTGKIIELPDYWLGLVNEDTITVDLTPIGKHQKLYVEKIEGNRVYINNEGLFSGSISCFYTVWGERKDVGSLEIELDE
jgi:hypothetical protein